MLSKFWLPVCLSSMPVFAQGQSTLSPSQFDPPEALRQLETAQTDLAPPGSRRQTQTPLHWGPVNFRPRLDFGVSYGDGLMASPGFQQETAMVNISPGMSFELGSNWALNYTPRLSYYSHEDFEDTVAHYVSLKGGALLGDWRLGLLQTYDRSSDPLVETGAQTDQENFSTMISARRPVGSRMLLELGFSQLFRSADEFSSSRTWSTTDWLNYQVASRLSVGAGLGAGFDDVSDGTDMTHEQLLARVNARIAEKLNFNLNGGVEFRQFRSSEADSVMNPIYGASIQYRPFQYTTLTLAGSRRINPSLFEDQINDTTSISLGLSQRLLGLFFLTVSGGLSTTEYSSTFGDVSAVRSDDHFTFLSSLSYSFFKRATASVYYQYGKNQSDSAEFEYDTNQVGLNLSYRF